METTGTFIETVERDEDGNIVNVSFEHVGGNLCSFTTELLETADHRFISRDGDIIRFGQHRLEVLATQGEIIYARLIEQGDQ